MSRVLHFSQPSDRAATVNDARAARPIAASEAAWLTVARALDGRDDGPVPDERELRGAVRAMVGHLRERGFSPERALVMMKGLAAGAASARREQHLPPAVVRRLADISTWSIEAYYSKSPATGRDARPVG